MRTLCFALLCLFAAPVFCCTGIKLRTSDGSIVHGRTAEFGIDLDLSLLFIPRGYDFRGTTPRGGGLSYTSKYAAIGVVAFDEPALLDGINERGLSAAGFYFPGYAGYASTTGKNQQQALSPLDFCNWIITQFATVDEVKAALNKIVVVGTAFKDWGPAPPPFHYIVFDRSGRCIVIEPIDGNLVVHENKLGVITNSPTFDWHMTNLNNYVYLSPFNVAPKTIDGVKFSPLGQGSGMQGLPGDFSPPSRFVRAAVFSMAAETSKNAPDAVLQAFHILNQFDIPVGVVREAANGVVHTDRTLATAVRDPQSLRYYLRTYSDQSIRMADLKDFNLNADQLQFISIAGPQPIEKLTTSK